VTLLMPLTAASSADANPPQRRHPIYYVYYRTCPDEPWRYYAAYHRQSDAERAVRQLRSRNGVESFMRR
jgi:hypothetical protein